MLRTFPKHAEYLLLVVAIWLIPDIAYAQVNSVANVLCKVVDVISGPLGTAIAMLGVVSIGLVAMFGKIQISSVLTLLTGIAVIFGADDILTKMVPSFSGCITTTGSALAADEFVIMLSCILAWFVGPLGKTIASLALILIGLLANFGRISWHQAMLVAVGIATIFGSASILGALDVPITGGNSITLPPLCSSGFASVVSIDKIFCNMYNWFNGPLGKGVATIGMLVLGVGALFGKISWGIAVVYGVGVALIFGSDGIVMALGASSHTPGNFCETGAIG